MGPSVRLLVNTNLTFRRRADKFYERVVSTERPMRAVVRQRTLSPTGVVAGLVGGGVVFAP